MDDRLGAGGYCICPKCTTKIRHQAGIPCQEEKCPNCGSKMLRVGSHHHQLWEEKQK
jgi:predicted amidophosphoribosyltransferase